MIKKKGGENWKLANGCETWVKPQTKKNMDKIYRFLELKWYEAKKENKGVAIMNGKFIGPPMVITAKKIIDRDKLIQMKNRITQ